MNSSQFPLVSLIIPLYNKEKYIEETLESIIRQTYKNWEAIVIDDWSTDGSVTIVKEYVSRDKRFKLGKSIQNSGANVCRNMGIDEAKGHYLLFIDADDLLEECCIEERVLQFVKQPTAVAHVFTLQCFYKKPHDCDHIWKPECVDPLKQFLMHQLPWQTMQPLWRAEVVKKEKYVFDVSFDRLQDVDFHTNILLDQAKNIILHNTKPDCWFRIDEARKTSNPKLFLHKWIQSANQYCDKYSAKVKPGYKKYLLGTVFKTIEQLGYHYRHNLISKTEFAELKQLLYKSDYINSLTNFQSAMVKYCLFNNSSIFKIKGVNQLLLLSVK